ncbi:MFS transporter [Azospirillum sp. ST 5-10]|uniref:MFS transporter n=1 Tax=unclassified Azospirillum TaxID=2630922 RepID=UPI003F4A02FA
MATDGRLGAMAAVNAASFLAQTVQIGALPTLIGLVLAARGFDPFAIGVLATAPWLAVLALARLVPRLLARVGARRAVAGSGAVSAAATLLLAFAGDVASLFALNAVVGAAMIVRWVACDTWIVALAPPTARGRAIGLHEALLCLGIAAGPLLLSLTGIHGLLPFAAGAAVQLAALPCVLPLTRRDHRPEAADGHRPAALRRLLGLLPVALLGAFAGGFVETAAGALMAVYVTGLGFPAVVATLLLAAHGAGATLLQVPLGWFADRFGSRAGQVLCAAVLLAGAAAIPPALAWPWLAAAPMFLWGGAVGGLYTLAVMEAGTRTADSGMAGALAALAVGYTLGSLAGPAVAGAVMEHATPHGLMLTAGGMGAVLLALAAVRRPSRAAPAPAPLEGAD